MPRKKSSLDEFLVSVGDNIRRIRRERGYTLDELGIDIGLDKSNMHRIEQGKNITLLTLVKVAAFLEVNPQELLKTSVNIALEDAESYIRKKKKESSQ